MSKLRPTNPPIMQWNYESKTISQKSLEKMSANYPKAVNIDEKSTFSLQKVIAIDSKVRFQEEKFVKLFLVCKVVKNSSFGALNLSKIDFT